MLSGAFGNLTSKQLLTFQTILKALISAPILHLPQSHQPYSIDTDVSDYQMSCVYF